MGFFDNLKKGAKNIGKDIKDYQAKAPEREKAKIAKLDRRVKMETAGLKLDKIKAQRSEQQAKRHQHIVDKYSPASATGKKKKLIIGFE